MRKTATPSFARVVLFALSTPAFIRLRFSRLVRILERIDPQDANDEALALVERRVERALGVTGRVMRHTCFTRGLTRFYFLRRAGADVELIFGMRPNGDGHCWVRLDGAVYRDPSGPVELFTQTYSIPRGA